MSDPYGPSPEEYRVHPPAPPRVRRRPSPRLVAGGAAAVLAVAAIIVGVATAPRPVVYAQPAASATATPSLSTVTRADPARAGTGRFQDPRPATSAPVSTAAPVRLRIPAIGVDAPFQRLHVNAAGVLQAPTIADHVGWWSEGVRPGAVGAAVIAGHLDNILGPAVFVDLHRLKRGDEVRVVLADRSVLHFRVTDSGVVAKARFPTRAVYGAVPDAELRLITCNDPFDPASHSYSANLVVSAVLEG